MSQTVGNLTFSTRDIFCILHSKSSTDAIQSTGPSKELTRPHNAVATPLGFHSHTLASQHPALLLSPLPAKIPWNPHLKLFRAVNSKFPPISSFVCLQLLNPFSAATAAVSVCWSVTTQWEQTLGSSTEAPPVRFPWESSCKTKEKVKLRWHPPQHRLPEDHTTHPTAGSQNS